MKLPVTVAALLASIFIGSVATAHNSMKKPTVEIDFDDLTVGDQLGMQYANLGVVFEGTFEGNLTAGFIGTEPDFNTYFFGNSEPNFAIVGVGSLTVLFIDPNTQQPSPVSDVSFRAGDADVAGEGFAVTAFDEDGNVLHSEIVHLFEKGATINIPQKDITEIRIFGSLGCLECWSGFAIDDLKYRKTPH